MTSSQLAQLSTIQQTSFKDGGERVDHNKRIFGPSSPKLSGGGFGEKGL
jgi:hypothetical protein